MSMVRIQNIKAEMQEEISQFMKENWGSTVMVSKGHVHQLDRLPGFIVV